MIERSRMTKPKKEWLLTPEVARKSLENYVVRARRVEAHSLVKSGEVDRLAEQTITTSIDSATNVATVRLNCRPEDEEIFESLAARIRPCITGDPVNVRKSARSLKLLAKEALTVEQDNALNDIINWYDSHIEERNPIFGFEEIESLNDPTKTVSAPDVTLGMGWLYTDLVHANPNSKNNVAVEFPYNSRYQNGVVLISHLALKITKLLELIREIDSKHSLGMREGVWGDQVCAGNGPLDLHNAKVYIGQPLCDVPADTQSSSIEGLEPLTAMRLSQLRNPHRKANLICLDTSDNVVAHFPGIYQWADDVVTVNLDYIARLSFFPADSPRIPVNSLPEGSLGAFAIVPFEDRSAETEDIIAAISSSASTRLELVTNNGVLVIPLKKASSASEHTVLAQEKSITSI